MFFKKKIFKFSLVFSLFFSFSLISQTKFITLSVSALGETEQIAINNALIEALSQINGAVVEGNMSLETFSQSRTQGEEQDYYYSKKFSQDLSKHTEGIIDSYQITNSSPSDIGGWEIEVSVTIAKYALSPQTKRKRIAVMPFRITDTRELIVQNKQVDKRRVLGLLNQSLVTQLTQSRKFFVADRDFVEEIYSERNFIQYGDVPLSELSKLGNDLGVDLILVGVIEDFNTKSTKKNFPSLNKTFVSTNGIVEISYRVIDVATRQIKYSNLYLSDSGTTNSNADTQMILDASSKIGERYSFCYLSTSCRKNN
jgi:curli biogenesis system outer membrane secretion channel CsgG